MKIHFISPELHAELTTLCTEHPELCFQNVGYQYLGREVLGAKAEQLARIEAILKEHVIGFHQFFNFRRGKDGEIVLRFDYNWGASFTGVGYLLLDHLRDGFPEGASQA
jgi:hypothetical protein